MHFKFHGFGNKVYASTSHLHKHGVFLSISPNAINMRGAMQMEMSGYKGVCSFFRTFKVKMKISAGVQWEWESFQGKQRFAYNTGAEISEGLHSRLSTGGTELRLKEPED